MNIENIKANRVESVIAALKAKQNKTAKKAKGADNGTSTTK